MAVAKFDRFTCFSKLPLELQTMVWSYCPFVGKQVIHVEEVEGEILRRYIRRRGSPTNLKPYSEEFPNETFISVKYIVPPPLHICSGSRKLALQHYRRVPTTYGDTKEGSAPFYINFDQDSILFGTTYKPDSRHPALYFWVLEGKTLSTPDSGSLCTSVATRWTESKPPTFEHALYIMSRLPDIKNLYFLDCPIGPFPQTYLGEPNLPWMKRDQMERMCKRLLCFYSSLRTAIRVAGLGSDLSDMTNGRGIYRSNWKMPLISCITSEEFNSL